MISCSFDIDTFFGLFIAARFAGVQSSELTVGWCEKR